MKVLIVDGQVLLAEALGAALEDQCIGRVDVASCVADVEANLMSSSPPPDVVVLDLEMGGALELGRTIAHTWPNVRVLALTGASDARTDEAIDAGFGGPVTKSMPVANLKRAIETAATDDPWVEAGAHSRPSHRRQNVTSIRSDAALLAGQLTRRERQVLQLLTMGATSEEIAETMCISRHTVRTHVQGILGKLGVHSRLEAAAFAIRHGLADTTMNLSA